MEHNSISTNYTQIWRRRSKVLKVNRILLNSMCVGILAWNVLEPKHKPALQKVAKNIGLVSWNVDFFFVCWYLLFVDELIELNWMQVQSLRRRNPFTQMDVYTSTSPVIYATKQQTNHTIYSYSQRATTHRIQKIRSFLCLT